MTFVCSDVIWGRGGMGGGGRGGGGGGRAGGGGGGADPVAAPGLVVERDPAAERGHRREVLPACRGLGLPSRPIVPPAVVTQIGKAAHHDNRLANCLRPERGLREAIIDLALGMSLEIDPTLVSVLVQATSLQIVQMLAINRVVA